MNKIYSFLSDVHANLVALVAVLSAIKASGEREIISLGDNVNYGPNPKECLEEIIRVASVIMLGNHDYGTLNYVGDFNLQATRCLEWTRKQLGISLDENGKALPENHVGNKYYDMIASYQDNFVQFVSESISVSHACPALPGDKNAYNMYVMEKIAPWQVGGYAMTYEMALEILNIEDFFQNSVLHLICHTHVSGCFILDNGVCKRIDYSQYWDGPSNEGFRGGSATIPKDGSVKVICNTGSVGQPRDRKPGISRYVDVEETDKSLIITPKEVEFDITQAVAAIVKAQSVGLPYAESLSQRLQGGY